ncbi:inovirus-type Gp2 protein [Serratia fonticola]|uniref:Inovirus-type Gp2 protein n=1 Tax=Serratia fonticola TaxID=47917 RepID=A0AAJ1YLB1_SERFO|nr:inovirus-type Gp2 protein [Serratia fonticola]MDQ9130205.1 inovirus-type Gp2 protein [Serratia fonticola]
MEYPENGKYDLLARDIRVGIYPGDLLNRIDYLTKVRTKVFEDDYRSFGCSNG